MRWRKITKIYPLSVDVVFKIFFKNNKKYVALILNDYLGKKVNPDEIKDLTTVHEPEVYGGKTIINDLVFELPDATVIFMEMQNNYNKFFRKRMEYYTCKIISDLLKIGSDYDKVKPVYGFYFINTTEDFSKFFTKVTSFDNIKSDEENVINMIVINLAYIDAELTEKESLSLIKFMKINNEKEMINLKNENFISKEVYAELEKIAGEPKYREILSILEKEEHDRVSEIKAAKEDGIDEGVERGKAQGIAQGKAQGIKQMQTQFVITLFQNKQSIENIKSYTNLNEDIILGILKDNGYMN